MLTHETDEEIYNVINDALLCLCEQKPNDPVDFLSRKMLELIGDNPTSLTREKSEFFGKKAENEILITATKLAIKEMSDDFNENYKIKEHISSQIYLVEDLKNNNLLRCARLIPKKNLNINLSDKKIKMLMELDNPNVIKVYQVLEDEKNIYIIHDYCPYKDILTYLSQNKDHLTEETIRNILSEVFNGLSYLHQKGIIHKNLTPKKLLVYNVEGSDLHIKISSFFLNAETFTKGNYIYKSRDIIIPPLYLAPEFIDGKYNNKVDIWSMGIICYILFVGKPPFTGKDHEIIFQITHNKITFPEGLNKIKLAFLQKMLSMNPNDRVEADVLLKDKYFQVGEDELVSEFDMKYSEGLEIVSSHKKKENKYNVEKDLFEAMDSWSNFSIGETMRRSILSFIISKKLYNESDTKLRKIFQAMDVDHDGKIECEELFLKYRKFFPGTNQQQWERIKKFIQIADINNNGIIEYSEFLTVMTIMKGDFDEKILRNIFNYYDKDNTGYIEAIDIKEIFEDTDITDKQIHEMLDAVDQNGDRKISFEEFVDIINQKI